MPGCGKTGEAAAPLPGAAPLLQKLFLPGVLADASVFPLGTSGAQFPGDPWDPYGTMGQEGGRGAGGLVPGQGSEGAGEHPHRPPDLPGELVQKSLCWLPSEGRKPSLGPRPPMNAAPACLPRHVI